MSNQKPLPISNPRDAVDQSCWILLNELNELLNIGFNSDSLNDSSKISNLKGSFWIKVNKQLESLCTPFQITDATIKDSTSFKNRFKLSIEIWKNRMQGYDLQTMDILYFLDMFNLLDYNYEIYHLNYMEKFKVKETTLKGLPPKDNPFLNVKTTFEFYRKIVDAIYKITMTSDYYFLEKRRNTLEKMKFEELGWFSRLRAKLGEESSKVAKTVSEKAKVDNLQLTEIYVEIGINIKAIEGKVGLKFERDETGQFQSKN